MLAGALRGGAFRVWERDRRMNRANGEAGPEMPPDFDVQVALDSVVTDQFEAGLRWVGYVDAEGAVLAGGGIPMAVPFAVPSTRGTPVLVPGDGRVRAYFRPPGDGSILVVEFEPVIARALVASARRSLVLAAIVAALLTFAAVMLWRLSLRFEAAELRMQEQRRLTTLGEMSAVLAHEIRNPLASLKGNAQLLVERMSTDSNERRKVERIVDEAARLEALTSDLLDFAGAGPLHLEEVDPLELAELSAAEAAPAGAVSVKAGETPTRWPLEARRFRQALVNLIRNASQMSTNGEPAEVEVTTEPHRLVITVRDRGPGLPVGQEERIFDPFFTTRTTGTGLGLPVAKRIVELHGGTLAAENATGGGAVFRIEIPRAS